jgi:hypothetical protein
VTVDAAGEAEAEVGADYHSLTESEVRTAVNAAGRAGEPSYKLVSTVDSQTFAAVASSSTRSPCTSCSSSRFSAAYWRTYWPRREGRCKGSLGGSSSDS